MKFFGNRTIPPRPPAKSAPPVQDTPVVRIIRESKPLTFGDLHANDLFEVAGGAIMIRLDSGKAYCIYSGVRSFVTPGEYDIPTTSEVRLITELTAKVQGSELQARPNPQ